MFDIADTKIFMDSVHGYISVPKCFVKHLIDTTAFQRLRNIDQTGMRILYPDAKHDRFGHSLGVYHLGSKAVDALLKNFSQDNYWNISSDRKKVVFWAKNKVLFLIACLLHDIGHAPFSHALEKLVLENSAEGEKSFTARLVDIMNQQERQNEMISLEDMSAAPHEKIGAMFIIEQMEAQVRAVFEDLIAQQYPSSNSDSLLYAEHYHYNPVIDTNDLPNDICFIARMILGLKYKGYEPEKQIRNCFIELLNGGNFDVDKLDYIIRDTKMSGISNISIDIDRLLNSVSIVTKTKCTNYNFHKKYISNQTIYFLKNSEENRVRIRGNFRGTIRLEGNASICMERGSRFLSLKASGHGVKIRYADGAPPARFSKATEIVQDGKRLDRTSGQECAKTLSDKNGDLFECSIRDAEVLSEEGFYFVVSADSKPAHFELEVNGFCDITIEGKCSTKSSITLFEDTFLDGKPQEIIFLGNLMQNTIPNPSMYNTFSVGFRKQAINIIANVLEARDYLYLWIYAHHKVIYYANFLIPVIAAQIAPSGKPDVFPQWQMNYSSIQQLDDAYIWTAIKYSKWEGELRCLCAELLSRTYKQSLYKSLAEYDLLFEPFTVEQRLSIKSYLADHSRDDRPRLLDDGIISAGYLDDETLEKLRDYGASGITALVFVDASYRSKKSNPHDTLIVMGDEIVSIDRIPLLTRNIAAPESTAQYVYFYYEVDGNQDNTIVHKLKNALKKLFQESVVI